MKTYLIAVISAWFAIVTHSYLGVNVALKINEAGVIVGGGYTLPLSLAGFAMIAGVTFFTDVEKANNRKYVDNVLVVVMSFYMGLAVIIHTTNPDAHMLYVCGELLTLLSVTLSMCYGSINLIAFSTMRKYTKGPKPKQIVFDHNLHWKWGAICVMVSLGALVYFSQSAFMRINDGVPTMGSASSMVNYLVQHLVAAVTLYLMIRSMIPMYYTNPSEEKLQSWRNMTRLVVFIYITVLGAIMVTSFIVMANASSANAKMFGIISAITAAAVFCQCIFSIAMIKKAAEGKEWIELLKKKASKE